MIVYHYTTEMGFNEIGRTGQFRVSTPWTTMDATYGTGWYFTDLGPDTCDVAVAYHCWRNTSSSALVRITYYLKFDIEPKLLQKTREHVYMVRSWDKELIKYLGGDKNKDCPSKPCETCDKAKKYRNPSTRGWQQNSDCEDVAQSNKLIVEIPAKEKYRPSKQYRPRLLKRTSKGKRSKKIRRREPPPPTLSAISLSLGRRKKGLRG